MAVNGAAVYIVDDDKAVRDSLRWLIESIKLNVETFSSAQEFLENYRNNTISCLLLDIRMPGLSGLELQQELKQRGIHLPVIFITGHGDVPMAVRAMKAGAYDFIEKPFNDQELLDRIQQALLDYQCSREKQDYYRELKQRVERLTVREDEVMNMVVDGKQNKDIATKLGISTKTVEVHRAHVMDKMGASSVAELVRMAIVLQEFGY